MATYDPPTETLPIFDPNVFTKSDTALTSATGDLRYLKFPYAQGAENLQQVDVYGVATFNTTLNAETNIVMGGTDGVNYIEFPDTTKQYTAYTGETPLVPDPSGNYTTPSSISINSLGQVISAVSGTTYSLPSPAPTAGSYTNANISVNSAGQITSVSNGTIASNSTTTIVVQPTTSTPVSVPIPTNCIRFDIAVYGSGGLSTPAIYYPAPNPESTAYTIQTGAGGGGGFAKIAGIYQPRQVSQKENTLTITMTLGNGNFTLVSYNGTTLAQVYNGTNTTATFLAGGAGCSTAPVVNTTYGSWFSSNGTQGQSGADRGLATTPLNLQGGQNIAGGALVNTQMGVGQSYASYSSPLASWSASPIGYGGAVITFYA